MIGNENHRTDAASVERLFARGLVVAGGLFWIIAMFAGRYVFGDSGTNDAVRTAIWPFAAACATLIVGWTYERLAALLLVAGSTGVIVWGVLFGWEIGVWIIMATVLISPMLLAAVLFTLAGRERELPPTPDAVEAETPYVPSGTRI